MAELVGILNVTPDSFSDGGRFIVPEDALRQAKQLFDDGASLVDVGAESTRPGAAPLSDDEEWVRLQPVLEPLLAAYPGKISLDTYHPVTVRRAFEIGPVIVNDVTGMNNLTMLLTVAELGARCIISHAPGTDLQAAHRMEPVTMGYEVQDALLRRAALLERLGLPRERIILDPGIGFGKTEPLNWSLLRFAEDVPEYAVMVGPSRKRFLGERRMELEPNVAAARIAIEAGAAYVRVHDVAGHRRLLNLTA